VSGDPKVLAEVAELGAELTAGHLLEHASLDVLAPALDGDDRAVLAEPRFEPSAEIVHMAPTLRATPIAASSWDYQQGAYPVLRDFLEARTGRSLSPEEFSQFRLLAAAVKLSIGLLETLDDLLPRVAETALPNLS